MEEKLLTFEEWLKKYELSEWERDILKGFNKSKPLEELL